MSYRDYAVAEALESAVAERGQKAVGRIVGVAHTTIGRWDLTAWPLVAALSLADADEGVRAALLDRLARQHPDNIEAFAAEALVACGRTVAELAADLADRDLSPAEARRALPVVHGLVETASALLTPLRRRAETHR